MTDLFFKTRYPGLSLVCFDYHDVCHVSLHVSDCISVWSVVGWSDMVMVGFIDFSSIVWPQANHYRPLLSYK